MLGCLCYLRSRCTVSFICIQLAAATIPFQPSVADTPPATPSYDTERCKRAEEFAKQNIPVPYLPTEGTEDVFLRVNGARYAIPANYFRYPPIGCDTEEDGFLLRVLLPGFEGYSEENKEAMSQGGADRVFMNILLHVTNNPDMKRSFKAFARDVDFEGDHPIWQGLFHAKNWDGRARTWSGDDVYFLRDDGNVVFFSVCRSIEKVPFPGCRYYFRYRGAFATLSFGRKQMAEWKEIHSGTISLLDRFFERGSQGN